MALPKLTAEQRAEALKKATESRRRRAEVKTALKEKKMDLAKVIELAETDEAIAKMKVRTLLESLPRVGTTTAGRLMEEIGIADSRRVRGLGPHQREELFARFS